MDYIEWVFRTRDSGNLTASYASDSIPQYSRGESMTMRFKFERRVTVPAPVTGTEYGDSEYDRNVYATSQTTTEVPGPYVYMRRFAEYAGAVTTGTSMYKTPWYKERLPDSAPFNTHLVAVEPSSRIATKFPGFWAIIVDVEDVTDETLVHNYLDISFWVLAELNEYDDHSSVENAFKK